MKKVNKNKKRSIIDLFTKKVSKKELPARDTKTFIAGVESNKKLEKEVEKLRYEIEKIETPIYQAKMGGPRLEPKQFEEIHKKKLELENNFYKKFGAKFMHLSSIDTEDTGIWKFSRERIQTLPEVSDAAAGFQLLSDTWPCKTISVTVCKEKVCVHQPLPMYLDYIVKVPNSPGSFSRNGNIFTYNDGVQGGYYYENLMYHRTSQIHEGQINISASTEISEDSKIFILSIAFIRQAGSNAICAIGEDYFGYPPNWGWGIGYYEYTVKTKKPGEGWHIEYTSPKIQYENTGKVDARISCATQVLGVFYSQGDRKTFFVYLSKSYPAGTQFLFEISLSYWIKALGEYGNAWISHNLKVLPEIYIEACTLEWPDTITIEVPEWIGD